MMGTSEVHEFPDFLRSRLLQGVRIRAYHVSTPASTCPPLFAPAMQQSGDDTTLESHFLAISEIGKEPTDTTEHLSDVLVLGIEVLIFTCADLTTIFVSKADSTGLLKKAVTVRPSRSSLAQTVITAFLQFLLRSRQYHRRLVLSLFARSQNQYLFPGSIENATKHVLDDRQLIKWWCRVLDPLVRQKNRHSAPSVKAHVVVPGCDRAETKAFFPPSARSDPATDPKWVNDYPVDLLVENRSLPPRCLVPRLPDDPKSRFLDDLDTQCDEHGSWRGIKTLDQFWEMMSYRQECSAGRLVGFVWVVFTPDVVSRPANGVVSDETSIPPQELTTLEGQRIEQVPSKPAAATPLVPKLTRNSQSTHAEISIRSPIDPNIRKGLSDVPALVGTKTATSVTEPIVGETVPDSRHDELQDVTLHEVVDPVKKPAVTADISLSASDYQTLMDELLQLDFAGQEVAGESSKRWRDKAMQLAGVSTFGIDVHGESTVPEQSKTSNIDVTPAVNMITGVRKKRKTSVDDAVTLDHVSEQAVVYTLASNLIRKKVKQ